MPTQRVKTTPCLYGGRVVDPAAVLEDFGAKGKRRTRCPQCKRLVAVGLRGHINRHHLPVAEPRRGRHTEPPPEDAAAYLRDHSRDGRLLVTLRVAGADLGMSDETVRRIVHGLGLEPRGRWKNKG